MTKTAIAPAAEASPLRRRAQPVPVLAEMCRPGDLKALFGISRTRAYALLREGAIRAVKPSAKLTLIEVESVREWLARQSPARFGHDPVRRAAPPAA